MIKNYLFYLKNQSFIILIALLVFFRAFDKNSLVINIVITILMLSILYEGYKFFYNKLILKKTEPLSLLLNIGIVIGILIFSSASINLFDEFLFNPLSNKVEAENIRLFFISSFYSLILIIANCYLIASLSYFFFLKQRKDLKIYFNTMWIFIILTSLLKLFDDDEEIKFIKLTLLTVTVLLIIINSLRISWIAFLAKKQKLLILLYSFILIIISGYLISLTSGDENVSIFQKLISETSKPLMGFSSLLFIYCIIYFCSLFIITLFHLPTADVYEQKAKEVDSMQTFSNLLSQVFSINDLSDSLLQMTIKVFNSDSAWIRMFDRSSGTFNPFLVCNISHQEENILSCAIIEGIEDCKLNPSGTFDAKYLRKTKNELSQKFHSQILYSEMKIKNEVIGYLFTSRNKEIKFDTDEEKVIKSFADYSAIAYNNNRMYTELVKKEKLERELDVAREIQQKIIPSEIPILKELDISASFIPAFEVGGDYYDFYNRKDGNFSMVIADVSGKGVGAAFYMAVVEGIFESLSMVYDDPKTILLKANEVLKKDLGKKDFVTATYCTINFEKKSMKIVRAGHCPTIIFSGEDIIYLKSSGLGLGLDNSEIFSNSLEMIEYNLKENDILVFYTDGISEAKNRNNEDYGLMRLENIVYSNRNDDTNTIARKIIQDVTVFSENGKQHDDITLVIMKCKGKTE